MSDSSDSDDYSSRAVSKTISDENFNSTKNNFIKELYSHSNMCDVAQNTVLKANKSFDDAGKERRESNPKRINFSLGPDELAVSNCIPEEIKGKSKSKKRKLLTDDSNHLEQEPEVAHKKQKKSKHRHRDKNELDSSVRQPDLQLETAGSKQEKKLKKKKVISPIITSTQNDRTDLSVEDINNISQSLLDFEQKNLSINNIEADGSEDEDELDIDKLVQIQESELQTKSLNFNSTEDKKKAKKKKKNRSESETSPKKHKSKDDILKALEKSNSLKKIKFESDSLHNLQENSPCFILKVPVGVDLNQLIGKQISLNNKKKIKLDDSEYVASPDQDECSLTVLGENNQHLHLDVSHCVKIKLIADSKPPPSKEKNDLISSLLSEKLNSINSSAKQKKAKLEKSPSKTTNKNKVEQLDRFLQEGRKFMEDLNFISFRFKNEKLIADLDRQTNLVLQKQVEFLQQQNTSSAQYKKMKTELAVQTQELLQKRKNIMKSEKVDNGEELSDFF